MIYPTSKQPSLADETFEKPGSEFRGSPFWSWNCHVTKELIDDQIPKFKAMGMGAVTAHPRVGLDLEYMSDEFLARMKDTCREAKKQDMRVILYDEDNFPSGNAGGLVTIHPQYRSRYLKLTNDVLPVWTAEQTAAAVSEGKTGFAAGFCMNRKDYEDALASGLEPEGYYVCSYRIILENGFLVDYEKLEEPVSDPDSTADSPTVFVRLCNLYLCVDPWNEQEIPYVDTMNPKAVQEFIHVTHERYEKALGEDFGTTAFAIFTDEPRLHNRNLLPYPEYEGNTTLAYTDDFSDTFAEAYGIPFLDILPEVLWELPDGRPNTMRYAYNDHLAERFASSYSDQIGAWCEAHGIASTGHLLSERTLFQQTYRLSEAMRQYRSYQIPGIDILCGDLEYSTAKQAVSVARQLNREGVISELYGVTNWDHTFKGHKLQGDWQAALGITLRVHHLSYMSMAGEGKRDWPGSIFYQSPWYKKYEAIETHFARLNTALTRGQAKIRIGVIHPVESYWLYLGNNAQTQEIREQMDTDFEDLIRWLIFDSLDFDFLCESLLPQLANPDQFAADAETETGTAPSLSVGAMKYDIILVPDLKTMRRTTLELLEAFSSAGGTVLFAGQVPSLIDAKPSEEAAALSESCVCVPFQRHAILRALEPFREVRILTPQGSHASDLLTQMRTDGSDRFLFVCHSEDKTDNVNREEKRVIEVKGSWNPVLYNTMTGAITPQPASVQNGWTKIPVTLYAEDSILLKLQPGKPAIAADTSFGSNFRIVPIWEQERMGMPLRVPERVLLSEPNVLLLDTPCYRFDDREWNRPTYCLTVETEYKRRLRIPNTQPYRQKNTAPKGTLSLRYEIYSETDSSSILASEQIHESLLAPTAENARFANGQIGLALEYQPDSEILWNGEPVVSGSQTPDFTGYFVDSFIRTIALPPLKKGWNRLEIRYPFGAKSTVEPCYLLGNFSVRLAGAAAIVGAPVTALIYGDITRQGLPFYTGNVTYVHSFAADRDADWQLEVPYYDAPVLDVSLDGKSAGMIAFAPHRLDLGHVSEGGHTISVTAYGNRYNCFAPLHNSDRGYKWYGPVSFRTSGYQWTDEYRIKPFGIPDHPYLKQI